ncbi:MAG: DUF4249 family protein [Deltaproteobacteria bacterium]
MFNKIHINYFIIIFIVIFFTACELSVDENIFVRQSVIWVDGIVGTDDSVKIFLGTTSGMNSGDIAVYRDDAKVELYINNTTIPVVLDYKKLFGSSSKGFYFYPRLGAVKPGDSLIICASIDNSNLKPIKAKAIFPQPVQINDIKLKCDHNTFSNRNYIDLHFTLDEISLKSNRFFEIRLKNKKYSETDTLKGIASQIEEIGTTNNLSISSGLFWSEKSRSIFVDYEKLEKKELKLQFDIAADAFKNDLEIELKTISPEYFEYSRALDTGNLGKSNIDGGSGIFTGYSRIFKTVAIK